MGGLNGDEPSLLPGKGSALSNRVTEQENHLCFQLDACKSWPNTQPLLIGLWVPFSPAVFAHFSCSLLSISSFWSAFHHALLP